MDEVSLGSWGEIVVEKMVGNGRRHGGDDAVVLTGERGEGRKEWLPCRVATASGSRSEEGEIQAMTLGRNDFTARQSFGGRSECPYLVPHTSLGLVVSLHASDFLARPYSLGCAVATLCILLSCCPRAHIMKSVTVLVPASRI
jgi:hypothetical protein